MSLRPISVAVDGDFARANLKPFVMMEDLDGEITYLSQYRLEVLKRVDGKGKLLAGMGTPSTD